MRNLSITKKDTPYLFRTPALVLWLIGGIVYYLYFLCNSWPKPGIIAVIISALAAFVIGMLAAKFFIVHIEELSAASKNRPIFKLFVSLPTPSWRFIGGLGLIILGILTVRLIAYLVRLPEESLWITQGLYLLTLWCILHFRFILWYEHLPD